MDKAYIEKLSEALRGGAVRVCTIEGEVVEVPLSVLIMKADEQVEVIHSDEHPFHLPPARRPRRRGKRAS